jgi:hypothetical protein
MAISDTQKVDLLFKKVGYGVGKTDIATNKSPANEGNASPLVSPGSTIYQQDYLIPSVTTLPSSNSSVVTIYRDSLTSTVQCTKLPTTSANVSWSTGLQDWIPVQYGTGYQVKLYAGPPGSSTPQNYISLPADGSGSNDSWYFDYQDGVVNFADTSVPTAANQNGNVVYVVGARYTGIKGITTFANLQISSITINGNTITGNTGVTFGGNITGNVIGTMFTQSQPYITTVGNTSTGNLLVNGFFWGNGNPISFSNYGDGNVVTLLSSFGSNSISTTGDIYGNVHSTYISTVTGNVFTFVGTGAVRLPIGSTATRPAGLAGETRFNTDNSTVEYYDGANWVPVTNSVTDQVITGDNTNNVFTLSQTATNTSILVSINGTVQQPGVAYTVSGTTITFAEIPASTDVIDIRFLGGVVNLNTTLSDDLSVSGNITLSGILSAPQTTKASNAPGSAGQICWDSNYIYVCTSANTWKRSPLTGGY